MNINQILKLEIIELDYLGMGIAKYDGVVIFVENALVGEVVEAKIVSVRKNFCNAIIVNIIKASKDRCSNFCLNELCGGCMLKHLEYKKQIEFKKELVEKTFKKIANTNIIVDEFIPMDNPINYRNKIQVPFKDFKYGFYKYNTHEIVETEICLVEPTIAKEILNLIKNLAIKFNITIIKHILIKYSKKLNQIMVVLILSNLKKFKEFENIFVEELKKLNVTTIVLNQNKEDTNVILGNVNKILYGEGFIYDMMNDLKFKIGVESFYQINNVQAIKLYEEAIKLACLNNNDICVDCYCGIGTITLHLAKYVKKVYGIEIVGEAIQNAKDNKIINNISNAEFILGKSEEKIEEILKKEKISCIFVDPPRKGLDNKFIDSIKKFNIPKIIYISCNVRTLARDYNLLKDSYNLESVKAVDLFPHTNHVETIILLSREKDAPRIKVKMEL